MDPRPPGSDPRGVPSEGARAPTAGGRGPRALIGRDEERAWATERVRVGGGVVIAGEAGVGKTRLADAVSASVQAAGAHVVRVVGTASLRRVALGALAWMLPTTNGAAASREPTGSAPSGGTADRLAAVCAALDQRAGDDDLVLVVDDAQWVDDATLAVARQLLLAGGAAVVATVRSGEPVSELLTALWKDELCERLDLQPLSTSQVGELAADRLGGPVEPATVERLARVTAGNPLYLRELVSGLVHAGAIVSHDGTWAWNGEVVVGERLAELLTLRIERLTPEARRLAVMVALGEPLPAGVVAALAPPAVIAEARKRGVLVTDQRGAPTVRLKHPLLATVLLDESSDINDHLGDLIDALRHAEDLSDADRVRLARWTLEAGAPDARALATAARILSVVDHDGATRLAAAAVDADDTVDHRLLYVETLVTALRYAEALAQLDVIDRRLGGADDDSGVLAVDGRHDGPAGAPSSDALTAVQARATADLWRISCLGWGEGDLEGVRAVVERFPDGHPARPMLEAHRSAVLAGRGSAEGAARAVELLDHPDHAVRFRALTAADLADCLAGRCELCIERAEGLLLAAVGDRGAQGEARWVLTPLLRGFLLAGRLDDFGHYLDLATETVSPRAQPAPYVALPQGRYALAQGRPNAAVPHLEYAVEQARLGELEPWWYRFAAAGLAEAYALVGRVDDAVAAAAESDEVAVTLRLVGPRPEDLDARRSLIWVEFAARGPVAGRTAAEAETQRCVDERVPMFELFARHDAVRLGSPAADHVDRMAHLAGLIQGRWPAPIEAQTRGIATNDPALLEEAAEGFAEIGAWMLGAEAAAHAAGVHRRTGDLAGERRADARAGALAALCDTASPLRTVAPDPAGLTEREQAVAERAAAGMTSKAIAAELYLSVRTVDNHLGRAYAKLGVRSRKELAARFASGAVSTTDGGE